MEGVEVKAQNISSNEKERHFRYLMEVKEIVFRFIPKNQARVYLYGSWARREERPTSDIDIGIYPLRELSPVLLSSLSEALEESAVPYRVEIVNLNETSKTFRERVFEEGVSWNA